jgi:N-acetylglucosaminyldiphosphoundecaprenol N-acetyl-beta-D-mannosaminyltransferase
MLRRVVDCALAGSRDRFLPGHRGVSDPRPRPERLVLMDVALRNVSMAQAVAEVAVATQGTGLAQFAFVNADCLNHASENARYRGLLNGARAVFADGSGIRLATRCFTPYAIRDNVNGTDMFPLLCAELARQGRSVFMLGAGPGVAEAAASAIKARIPALAIAGTHHGLLRAGDAPRVVAAINDSRADVLLVAMGAPRQELWIAEHAKALQVPVAIGVGGLFDFVSGSIPRAPLWMRRLGVEWLFRLRQEPARMWRRYILGNPRFLWRAWRWSRQQQCAPATLTQAA